MPQVRDQHSRRRGQGDTTHQCQPATMAAKEGKQVCPATGLFSKVWYLVTYEDTEDYQITADWNVARDWTQAVEGARCNPHITYLGWSTPT